MHLGLLPLLCLTPSALAGVLDIFARDRCLAQSWDRSKFKSNWPCPSISVTTTSATSDPSPSSVHAEVDSSTVAIISTVTLTTTVSVAFAAASSAECIATTCTATVTNCATTTVTAYPVTVTPLSSAQVVGQIVVQPSTCLSDPQATNIVDAFHNLLTNTDRSTVNTTAADLIADDYFEMSGSVNSLSGQAVTNITFPTRDAYLASLSAARAIPIMTTLDVFHDCNRIAWYWAVTGLDSDEDEVRGVSLLYTITHELEAAAVAAASDGGNSTAGLADLGNRKVNMLMLEFNSVAWAADTGRTLCAEGCAAA